MLIPLTITQIILYTYQWLLKGNFLQQAFLGNQYLPAILAFLVYRLPQRELPISRPRHSMGKRTTVVGQQSPILQVDKDSVLKKKQRPFKRKRQISNLQIHVHLY